LDVAAVFSTTLKHYLDKFHMILMRVHHTYKYSASEQSIVLEGRVGDNILEIRSMSILG
jgi:hypothetical protein